MRRWKFMSSVVFCRAEAVLRAAVILFLLEYPPRNAASSTEVYDGTVFQNRTTWCEERSACARCRGTSSPRCSKHHELFDDADLCRCCTSCVSVRTLGESCGSQLSVSTSSNSSSITILATTRCGEGLTCVDFECRNSGASIEPVISPWLKLHTAAIARRNDLRGFERDVNVTLDVKTDAGRESGDLLGRVVEIFVNDKRFQLVYNGDMLLELASLLEVIDEKDEESLLVEKEVDSLFEGFVDSVFPSTVDGCREKRELEKSADAATGFDHPRSTEDILIRGASAHKEYFEEARKQIASSNVADESPATSPVDSRSDGDESTVRVLVTNGPRRVETLVDLEETEEDEDVNDEGRVDNAGRLSPLANEEFGASPGFERTSGGFRTAEWTDLTEITTESGNPDLTRIPNDEWNETLQIFDERLSRAEIKIDVVETVLAEIAKWCNLGLLSMTRDCVVPQNSEIRHHRPTQYPDIDEGPPLASESEPVEFSTNSENAQREFHHRGHRRQNHRQTIQSAESRIDYRTRNYEPLNKNYFGSNVDDGQIRRRPIGGQSGALRFKMKSSPCRNPHRQLDSPTNKSIPDFGGFPLKVDRSKRTIKDAPGGRLEVKNFGTLQETQIPVPVIRDENVETFRKCPSREEIVPRGRTPAGEIFLSTLNRRRKPKGERFGAVDRSENVPSTGTSSVTEDDFDRDDDSVESDDVEGADFESHESYDGAGYVDGSSDEMVTEIPDRCYNGPEIEVRDALSRRERDRTDFVNANDECVGCAKHSRREIFSSSIRRGKKRETETMARATKLIGYRTDGIRSGEEGVESLRDKEGTINYGFSSNRPIAITGTPMSLPILKGAKSFIVGDGIRNGETSEETNNPVGPRIQTPNERRVVKKNGVKLLRG